MNSKLKRLFGISNQIKYTPTFISTLSLGNPCINYDEKYNLYRYSLFNSINK